MSGALIDSPSSDVNSISKETSSYNIESNTDNKSDEQVSSILGADSSNIDYNAINNGSSNPSISAPSNLFDMGEGFIFEIDKIIESRLVGDTSWYRVKWKNFTTLTWETKEKLKDFRHLIQNFTEEEMHKKDSSINSIQGKKQLRAGNAKKRTSMASVEEESKVNNHHNNPFGSNGDDDEILVSSSSSEDDLGEFEVEELIEELYDDDNDCWFLIKWKGYEELQWSKKKDLHCPLLIKQFYKKNGKRPPHTKEEIIELKRKNAETEAAQAEKKRKRGNNKTKESNTNNRRNRNKSNDGPDIASIALLNSENFNAGLVARRQAELYSSQEHEEEEEEPEEDKEVEETRATSRNKRKAVLIDIDSDNEHDKSNSPNNNNNNLNKSYGRKGNKSKVDNSNWYKPPVEESSSNKQGRNSTSFKRKKSHNKPTEESNIGEETEYNNNNNNNNNIDYTAITPDRYSSGEESEESSVESGEEPEYEVLKILEHDNEENAGEIMYLVQWKGYSIKEASWEPERHILPNAKDLLFKYWRSKGGKEHVVGKGQVNGNKFKKSNTRAKPPKTHRNKK